MEDAILFGSASALGPDVDRNLEILVEQIGSQMEGRSIDLGLIFLSPHFIHHTRWIVTELLDKLTPGIMLGCTAEGVITKDNEIEQEPAISMLGANLPGVNLSPFILQSDDWPVMLLDEEEFKRFVDVPENSKLIIALGDPFSTPMDDILLSFDNFYPGIPLVGGMASGALRSHGNFLFVNDRITDIGMVGLAMDGALDVDAIVSQGCRPIWRPFKITSARKNMIYALDDHSPLYWIQELVPELSVVDRSLLQSGLFVGRAIDSRREILGRGDFLIRGVIGIDQQDGSIAVGGLVEEGEMIQFHLRDSVTAREDLEMMLVPQSFRQAPDGGILFTCNGRGTKLYEYPDGDISVIQESLSGIPLAGFFCAGEIGPVGGRNFLHGHTASLVLFRSASET